MPNWLGDFVMGTAIFSDLRKRYANSEIVAFCQGPFSFLIEKSPYIDRCVVFKKNETKEALSFLKEEKFDIGILLTNSFSTAWIFFKARIPLRVGFKNDFRSLLLTRSLKFPKNIESVHLVHLYKSLLQTLEITPSSSGPQLILTSSEKENGKKILLSFGVVFDHPILGMCPSAAFGPAKCWPQEYVVELIELIKKSHPTLQIIIFGDESAIDIGYALNKRFPSIINLCGKTTLKELMSLLVFCDLLITNDSGPMHIADALKVKILPIFGSTNPDKTGPFYQKEVLYEKASCSPCYLRKCPIDFRCMKALTPQLVLKRVYELIGDKLC